MQMFVGMESFSSILLGYVPEACDLNWQKAD